METNPNAEKYAKAKIEEPNLRLPKAMLKPNVDQSTGELCYMKIFEDDLKKTKNLAEEIAADATLDRKVYRIRNMELFKAIGDKFEDMHQIHKLSKATIGLLIDSESDYHCHSFIDLVGTVEQVKKAEELILDKILKTYEGPVFPVILMPPTVHGHEIRLDVDRVTRLIGENCTKAVAIEIVSGAWLQVDDKPPAGGPDYERIVSIYGPKANVFKAVSLIYTQVFGPGECPEAEDEMEMLFQELSLDEVMEGLKSRNPEMDDFLGADFASGSDSSSGQTEEQKEQHDEEAKDVNKSEGEKLQKDEKIVEVAEDKDEPKGKKKQQHEEDVKKAVSDKPKGSVEELD